MLHQVVAERHRLADGLELVTITVRAPSFLYRQVRNTVGVLAAAGSGQLRTRDIADLLAARSRPLLPRGAPPEGLFLTRVTYPPAFLSLDAFPLRDMRQVDETADDGESDD